MIEEIHNKWFDDFKSYSFEKFASTINFIVCPANDFLIAMGFTAIYYYNGKNEKEKQWKQYLKLNILAINDVIQERTNSEIEQMLTDEAKKLVA